MEGATHAAVRPPHARARQSQTTLIIQQLYALYLFSLDTNSRSSVWDTNTSSTVWVTLDGLAARLAAPLRDGVIIAAIGAATERPWWLWWGGHWGRHAPVSLHTNIDTPDK